MGEKKHEKLKLIVLVSATIFSIQLQSLFYRFHLKRNLMNVPVNVIW